MIELTDVEELEYAQVMMESYRLLLRTNEKYLETTRKKLRRLRQSAEGREQQIKQKMIDAWNAAKESNGLYWNVNEFDKWYEEYNTLTRKIL
jgi:hypothetical protein